VRLTFTTLADQESAERIARQLVEAGLAACVNILSPCRSIYRWQGELHEDGEVPLVIKSTAGRQDELVAFLKQAHPYELPEIVSVEAVGGLDGYLDWVATMCATDQN
jgi:periplasmic divalent cation tolerance protein